MGSSREASTKPSLDPWFEEACRLGPVVCVDDGGTALSLMVVVVSVVHWPSSIFISQGGHSLLTSSSDLLPYMAGE